MLIDAGSVMKRFAAVVLVLIFTLFSVFAFENSSKFFGHLSDSEINTLMKGESLQARTNRGQDVFHLTPMDSEAYKLAYEASKAPHSFTVGVLQYIDYPDDYKNLSEEQIMLDVYNRMLKVSTMKGIKYMSYTAGDKMKTLFSDAHLISSPKNRKKVTDAVASILVPSADYYAFITDTKFGGNIYTASYKVFDDEILVEVSNYNVMKYFGFKCVDEKDLHMYIDVKFMEEGIAVCAFAVAYDTDVEVKALVTTVSLDGAFNRRINSLKDWFIERMAE